MKKSLYWTGGILGTLIILVAVVPYFIDWSQYKAPILKQVKEATGRDLKIDGPIRIALLPTPTVMVRDVKLSNLPGGKEQYMVQLKSLDLSLSLFNLFKGEIGISSLELVKPTIHLETLKDGRQNWDLMPKAKDKPAPKEISTSEEKAPPQDASMIAAALHNLIISDGTLTFSDLQKGSYQSLEGFNLKGDLDSLQGPFKLKGNLSVAGMALSFTSSVGKLDEKNIPLSSSLSIKQGKFDMGTMDLKGTIEMASLTMTGTLESSSFKAPLTLELPNKTLDFKKGGTFSSKITASPKTVDLPNIAIAMGGLSIKGSLKYGIESKKVSKELTISDGNAALKVVTNGTVYPEGNFKGQMKIASKDPQAFLNWIIVDKGFKIPAPLSVTTSLDVSAKRIAANSVSLSLGQNSLTGKFGFVLSTGDTNLGLKMSDVGPWLRMVGASEYKTPLNLMVVLESNEKSSENYMKGSIEAFGGDIQVKGTFDPNKLSYDFALAVNKLALSKITGTPLKIDRVSLKSQVKGTPQSATLTLLNSDLMGIDLKGKLDLSLKSGKPTLKGKLESSQVNLDPILAYMDLEDLSVAVAYRSDGVPLFHLTRNGPPTHQSPLPRTPLDLSALSIADVDVDLMLKNLLVKGFKLTQVKLPIKIANGTLGVSSLDASAYGGSVGGNVKLASSNNNLTTDLSIKNVSLPEAAASSLPQAAREYIRGGTINASMKANAKGKSVYDMVAASSGAADISVNNIALGVNVDAFVSALKKSDVISGVVGIFDALTSRGETRISSLKIDFLLKDGVLRSQRIDLDSEDVSLNGAAALSLISRNGSWM